MSQQRKMMGKTKPDYDVYDAVVNLDIGKKDLNLLLLPLKLYVLNTISFINFVYSMKNTE